MALPRLAWVSSAPAGALAGSGAGGQPLPLGVRAPAGSPPRGACFPVRHPPRLRGPGALRKGLSRLAHGRSRLCHPGPACRRLRTAASTAASGRVVRSSGPYGPLHRRPRLRHRTHRRGDASAASRPPQARARVVEHMRLSAQPPADCWTAGRCFGPPSARQRARTTAALYPCHWFLSPPIPLMRGSADRYRS